MKNILILFICSALLVPVLEQFVVGFDFLPNSNFSIAELVENEEENEVEEANVIQRLQFPFLVFELSWDQTDCVVRSLVREIPSPPPDSLF